MFRLVLRQQHQSEFINVFWFKCYDQERGRQGKPHPNIVQTIDICEQFLRHTIGKKSLWSPGSSLTDDATQKYHEKTAEVM